MVTVRMVAGCMPTLMAAGMKAVSSWAAPMEKEFSSIQTEIGTMDNLPMASHMVKVLGPMQTAAFNKANG